MTWYNMYSHLLTLPVLSGWGWTLLAWVLRLGVGVGVLGTTGDLTLEVELVRERMERSMVSGAVGTEKQGGIVCNAM